MTSCHVAFENLWPETTYIASVQEILWFGVLDFISENDLFVIDFRWLPIKEVIQSPATGNMAVLSYFLC